MQDTVKSQSLKRLKTARGHLDHVIKMVDQGKYCTDILQQSLAVQSALRAVDAIIFKGHMEEHVSEAIHGQDEGKSTEKVIDIFAKG